MLKYKIGLYIVSLILLFVSIIIKTGQVSLVSCSDFNCVKKFFLDNIPSCICLIFIAIGLVVYFLYFKELDGDFAHPKTIGSIENISNNHLSFLATYILPFVTFDFKDTRNWIILTFMLLIIGIIYVKTNFFYTNPTLSLFGVYVYYITFEGENTKIIAISRRRLKSTDIVRRRHIDENIYFVKK